MADIIVASATELYAALSSAEGGDRIVLAGGDYGSLDIREVTFSSDVTIVSADPDDPAIVRELYVSGATHLVFDGILFDYVNAPEDRYWVKPFQVLDSAYITIRNSVFDGDEVPSDSGSGEYGTGTGLFVRWSNNVTIENNEFFDFNRAVYVESSSDIVLRANDVHTVSSDGFNFASVDGVLIEGNWLHDFKVDPTGGAHADMIQFWTTLISPASKNIVIRDNFLDAGIGSETQSIFIRNEVVDQGLASFEDYAYLNILIEDNVIYNSHLHGITVGETDGLVVRNNTLLFDGGVSSEPNAATMGPRITISDASLNVTITSNILEPIWNWETTASHPGWVVEQNLFVQRDDPDGEHYYGNLFVNALVDDANLADLRAVAGGEIEPLGVGAKMTRTDIDITLEVGPAR